MAIRTGKKRPTATAYLRPLKKNIRIQNPKSRIQNPESKIPLSRAARRLMRDWSRLVELACITSTMQNASRMQECNAKSKIQNPQSRVRGRGRRLGFVRIIPGSEMRRAQILSFTAAGASTILLGARSRILTPPEFCSGLRRIRVGGARIQIPKSEPRRRWTGFDFAMRIQNPESRARVLGESAEQNPNSFTSHYSEF